MLTVVYSMSLVFFSFSFPSLVHFPSISSANCWFQSKNQGRSMQKMCVVFSFLATCNVKYWCQVDITESSTEHDVQLLSIAWIYIKRLQLKSFPRKSDPIIVDIVPSLRLFFANRCYKMHLQARTTCQHTTIWLSGVFSFLKENTK